MLDQVGVRRANSVGLFECPAFILKRLHPPPDRLGVGLALADDVDLINLGTCVLEFSSASATPPK